ALRALRADPRLRTPPRVVGEDDEDHLGVELVRPQEGARRHVLLAEAALRPPSVGGRGDVVGVAQAARILANWAGYNPRPMDIAAIQKALSEQGLDGWLLYDFRGSNPIARAVIGFDEKQIGTRRWFYFVPREGEPVAILHAIEPHAVKGAPGRQVLYRSWREL